MNDAVSEGSELESKDAIAIPDEVALAQSASASMAKLYQTLIALRSPDGCPWDREQTPVSLRKHLIEESYEVVDAIESGSDADVREELGDVLLLVAMLARCYEESETFSFAEVIDELNEKLIRRHPHVFGDATAEDSESVVKQWNDIKEQMEGKPRKTRLLDSVTRAAPPLERAHKLQEKAAKVGFDWSSPEDVLAKLREEIEEVEDVLGGAQKYTDLESEVGDLLFSAVNVSRFLGVDPTIALNRTNRTFYERFAYVEDQMKKDGLKMSQEQIDRMEELWQAAKDQ